MIYIEHEWYYSVNESWTDEWASSRLRLKRVLSQQPGDKTTTGRTGDL